MLKKFKMHQNLWKYPKSLRWHDDIRVHIRPHSILIFRFFSSGIFTGFKCFYNAVFQSFQGLLVNGFVGWIKWKIIHEVWENCRLPRLRLNIGEEAWIVSRRRRGDVEVERRGWLGFGFQLFINTFSAE